MKDESSTQVPKLALRKADVICCGVLEKMRLGWMKLEDGTRCMPYIKGHSDENMYRVNNCPSCGKYVRDVMVEPQHITFLHIPEGGGLNSTNFKFRNTDEKSI